MAAGTRVATPGHLQQHSACKLVQLVLLSARYQIVAARFEEEQANSLSVIAGRQRNPTHIYYGAVLVALVKDMIVPGILQQLLNLGIRRFGDRQYSVGSGMGNHPSKPLMTGARAATLKAPL